MQPLKIMSGPEVLMQPGAVLMSVASITTKGHVDLLTKALLMFLGHLSWLCQLWFGYRRVGPGPALVQESWPHTTTARMWSRLEGELTPHRPGSRRAV